MKSHKLFLNKKIKAAASFIKRYFCCELIDVFHNIYYKYLRPVNLFCDDEDGSLTQNVALK